MSSLGRDSAATEWTREDEPTTLKLLDGLSERFTQFVGFHLDSIAGKAHVELAKQVNASIRQKEEQRMPGEDDWKFARLALEEARKSVPENDGRPHPIVGAVVVRNGEVLDLHIGVKRPETTLSPSHWRRGWAMLLLPEPRFTRRWNLVPLGITPGRPSQKPLVEYKGFLYQAASWKTARRVVAKVEHHVGELFPRVGFIVTNLTLPSRAVVRFYNKRGTAEQWIKEGKQAVKMTRLSCHRFRSNEVRLWLSVIAYNLGNLWRRLALPKRIDKWSLTSLQQRLVRRAEGWSSTPAITGYYSLRAT